MVATGGVKNKRRWLRLWPHIVAVRVEQAYRYVYTSTNQERKYVKHREGTPHDWQGRENKYRDVKGIRAKPKEYNPPSARQSIARNIYVYDMCL